MDQERFDEACKKIIGVDRDRKLIGTLGEKTLHAVLKCYFEPYADNHEVKLGSFYADIVGEDGIIEIQTRSIYKLKSKLTYFLAVSRVTLVIPVPATKYIVWIDPESGEITSKRKSPKNGGPWDIFYELYGIKDLLHHPNLTVCVVMLETCDYRLLNGWNDTRKRGSSRFDRIPEKLVDEIYINVPEDYQQLLPVSFASLQSIQNGFTVKELAAALKTSQRNAYSAANILTQMDVFTLCGKKGRSNLYSITH